MIKGGVFMLKNKSCLCLMFCLLLSYDLVYIQFKFTVFVPLLCSIVLVVLSCITLSTITLVP